MHSSTHKNKKNQSPSPVLETMRTISTVDRPKRIIRKNTRKQHLWIIYLSVTCLITFNETFSELLLYQQLETWLCTKIVLCDEIRQCIMMRMNSICFFINCPAMTNYLHESEISVSSTIALNVTFVFRLTKTPKNALIKCHWKFNRYILIWWCVDSFKLPLIDSQRKTF